MIELDLLRDEVERLREEVRQLREALRPALHFPPEWHLTPFEADVLSLLVANRSVGQSAFSLVSGSAESLKVFIFRLRRKLPAAFSIYFADRRYYMHEMARRAIQADCIARSLQ